MGSETSQPLQSFKIDEPPDTAAAPAKPAPAKPAPPATPAAPNSPAESRLFNNCWSCRLLSGLGLLGAGGYVYLVARRPMKMGYLPSPGNITQMVIGIIIATWGIVIMADPKGKAYRIA
nr:distal membrane-arm assembly complex protein 1-like [Saimiri boliviensis boliviensis]